MDIAKLIAEFGFPTVAAVGLGYFVFYVWRWSTTIVKPIIGEATGTLITLIDRIRMLDNDLIRLNQKLNIILEYEEKQKMKRYPEEENPVEEEVDDNKVSKRE